MVEARYETLLFGVVAMCALFSKTEVATEAQRIERLCDDATVRISDDGWKLVVHSSDGREFLVFDRGNPVVIGNVDRLIALLSPSVRNLYAKPRSLL
jgi:hypothetical protein